MSTRARDSLAEAILAVLRSTATPLTPADIAFQLAHVHSRRMDPRRVLQYLHGILESAVVVLPNGAWRLRDQELTTDSSQCIAVPQQEDATPLPGELARRLGLPSNAAGGLMCMPPRGHLASYLSRFSLSLRGKHQHGILDRISQSRFGRLFFSLGSCEQLDVMDDAVVLHVDRLRKALSSNVPILRQPPSPRKVRFPVGSETPTDSSRESLINSHETDSPSTLTLDEWYREMLATEKRLFAQHTGNPLLERALTTWHVQGISRLPSRLAESSVRTILTMPLEQLVVMLNGDIRRIGVLVTVLRCIRRTLKNRPERATLRTSGRRKIPALAGETADQYTQRQYATRFCALQRVFRDHEDHALSRVDLRHWVLADDKCFPSYFLHWQARNFAEASFTDIIHTPVVGAGKIGKLLGVLDRVRNDILFGSDKHLTHEGGHGRTVHDDSLPIDAVRALSPPGPEPSEAHWREWCHVAMLHRLEHYTLGRLAPTLRYFPRSLWNVKLGAYTNLSWNGVAHLSRHGSKRRRLIVEVFRSMAYSYGAIPRDSHVKVCAVMAAIRDATGWIERHLFERLVPTISEMRHGFIEALLRQLDIDLGPEIREMLERRLGIDDTRQSLEEIGKVFQMSPARVGQLTSRAADVLHARWPESRFLLEPFCDQLALCAAKSQHDLLCFVMSELFGLAHRGSGLPDGQPNQPQPATWPPHIDPPRHANHPAGGSSA